MKIRSDNGRIKSDECDFEITASLKEEKLNQVIEKICDLIIEESNSG